MSFPAPHSAAPARSLWIDNLRTLIIILVVNMHACVTYSHVGDWYIMESPEPRMPVKIIFAFWQGHLQAFFMGLLFFLAGIFAQRSLARRGPAEFLRERLLRLGLPALFYMTVIHPFMVYVLLGHPHIPDKPPLAVLYGRYFTSGRVFRGSGPLWFALALLVFCAGLAAWKVISRTSHAQEHPTKAAPGASQLLAFAAVLAGVTFLVRLLQPIGTSVSNFQLCFFPQYIAAFIAGIAAGRNGWLLSLATSRRARLAGWLGLIGGPLFLGIIAWLGGPPPEQGPSPYDGGWNPRALFLAVWEQFAGLGLSLGLLHGFHKWANKPSRIAAWLSDRAFGVYVLHAPILVALTLMFRELGSDPFFRTALLTVAALACSFFAADAARRIPGLRAIL